MPGDLFLKPFTFAFYMTMAMIVSFLPLYFSSLGYSSVQVGFLYSLGPMMGIVSNLIWGFLSDKFQTVKKLLVLVLFGQLVSILFLFQVQSLGYLVVIMIGFYFFQSPIIPLNDSLTLLTAKSAGKSYASYRVWGSIGFASAALLFGIALKETGTALASYLCVGIIVVTLLFALKLEDRQASPKKIEFSHLMKVIVSFRFLWFMFLVLLISIAHRVNDGFIALYLKQLGASEAYVGISWLLAAGSEIPVFLALSKYGHRFKPLPLLAFAALFYTLRFFLMSSVHDPLGIVLIQLLHGFSYGIFLFTALAYLQTLVPDEFRATGQSLFTVVWAGISGLIGGVAGGWVFGHFGPELLYRITTGLAVFAGLGFGATQLFSRYLGRMDSSKSIHPLINR